jgi:hypothetical protein
MDLKYSKYFDCILYFFKNDNREKNLEIIKEKLNSPKDFYYNFDSENIDKRYKELFMHLVELYITEDLNGQYYKAIWQIIHLIPLVTEKIDLDMNMFFYEDYVFEKIECVNCISHYMNFVIEKYDMFTSSDLLFEALVILHNEVNLSRQKTTISDIDGYKEELKKQLEIYYKDHI